jgi:hypothetical protein
VNKFLSLVGIVICLGLAFYYDSSTASLTSDLRSALPFTPDEMEVASMPVVVEADSTEGIIPTLDYLLEKTEELDGYVVETYREYEFYYDVNGNLIKKVPTRHLDFIRYKK